MIALDWVVVLILHISTGQGHQDLHIEREMPSVQMCVEEVVKFLNHDLPEYIDGKVQYATCKKRVYGGLPT